MQINDLEENIASIVRRNDIIDDEIQGIKSDMISLADKILAIKVSSINERFSILIQKLFLIHLLLVSQLHRKWSKIKFLFTEK